MARCGLRVRCARGGVSRFRCAAAGGVEGASPTVATVRLTAMELANSGTVWAGIAVCAGWRIARAGAGALAGVCAAEGALLIHYTLGIIFGVYEPGIIAENAVWLVLGVAACAPLGVCGWMASWRGRSSGWRGRLNRVARLVVPVGAIVEPHARGAFSSSLWGHVGPQQHAEVASGVLLMLAGVCAAAWVLRKDRASSHARRASSDTTVPQSIRPATRPTQASPRRS